MNSPGQQAKRWCDNLIRPSLKGLMVGAADQSDEPIVTVLVREMIHSSAMRCHQPDLDAVQAWVREVLLSPYWLTLLLRESSGDAIGIALCQYITYEGDPSNRILKCKHFYVRKEHSEGLRSHSAMLVDAIVEAARRSPLVREVFIVTFGASDIFGVRQLLSRRGFRRIGTQHLGQPRRTAQSAQIRAVRQKGDLDDSALATLRDLGRAFYAETGRSFLGTARFDPEVMLDHSLGQPPKSSCTLIAIHDGRPVGFLTGMLASVALTTLIALQSSLLYVHPALRGGPVARQLLNAFVTAADDLGADSVLIGTSSSVNTDRVCRFLELRGFEHVGDVLSRPVLQYA